nr:DNA-3-methyladenine glycosylase 2 family protein [Planctomycetota bacterium]
ELLRATDLPLATIAAQSGVASVRTLARLVRTTTGAAPGRLRHRTPRPPAN